MAEDKNTHPGFRVDPAATHGPHTWGNGPKPRSKTLLGKVIDKIEDIQKGKKP